MSEANKSLVYDTWQAFWRGDIEAGLANFADDATWLVPGRLKASGIKRGKEEIRRFRESNLTVFAALDRKVDMAQRLDWAVRCRERQRHIGDVDDLLAGEALRFLCNRAQHVTGRRPWRRYVSSRRRALALRAGRGRA